MCNICINYMYKIPLKVFTKLNYEFALLNWAAYDRFKRVMA